ncbi:MAG TPA: fibronectin type III domain-containing protein [Bacteroidales bacterium]|nr:fibronectin type III domain-containing protein [Bacteroidales bacterium]
MYRDITFPVADAFNMQFYWKAAGESCCDYLKVYIVPTSVNPVAGTSLSSGQIGAIYNSQSGWQSENLELSGATYGGATWRVVFSWRNDGSTGTQPPAAVDNISITVLTCSAPSALNVSNVGSTQAVLNWTENGSATIWDIELGVTGFSPTGTPTKNDITKPYTYTGLSPTTTYQYYVRADCGASDCSAWIGPIEFTTTQIPGTLPYSETFETWPDGWTVVNGSQTNKWEVGSATKYAGSKSAYISNNSGTSNAYTNSSNSVVHMYRDITFPVADAFNMQFYWKGVGESADYLKAYLVPTTVNPNAGTLVSTDWQLGLKHYSQSTWQAENVELDGETYSGTTWRLVFTWRNDGYSGTQPPTAVDNVSIIVLTCPAPTALNATSVQGTQAALGWTENGSATTWDIELGPTGFSPTGTPTANDVTSNPYTYTGLSPSTTYQYYVRADCGGGDYSVWMGPYEFTTTQIPATLPFNEGFESGGSGWSFVNGTQTNKWEVDNDTKRSGSNSCYVSDDGGNNNDYTMSSASVCHIYRDIYFPEDEEAFTMSFYWKGQGEYWYGDVDYMRAYIVDPSITPVAGTMISASALTGTLNEQSSWLQASFDLPGTYAGQVKRLVFTWKNDGSGGTDPPAAVDDIEVKVAPDMVYVSGTTTQTNTNDVGISTTNQEIIGVQIVTMNSNNPLSVTSFTFNTSGSTDPADDISTAKLWSTGTSSTFATTNLLGSFDNPNGEFIINVSKQLSAGTNYFWLTYDITPTATINNYVDARCMEFTVAGLDKTPSVTNPSGRRQIKEFYLISEHDNEIITTCSGIILDSGGESGNYSNNEDYIMTIYSGSSQSVRLVFNSFNTESYDDRLYIYNGADISAPEVIGSYYSGSTSPGTIVSNGPYITLRFTSDSYTVYSGFKITISCVSPPSCIDCSNAELIPSATSFPFVDNNGSTCGACSNYSPSDACHSSYLYGEDYLYKFTPLTDMAITVDIESDEYYTGVFISQGCPDVGSCVGSVTTGWSYSESGGPFVLTGGITYYIVVASDYDSPYCTDYKLTIDEFDINSCSYCGNAEVISSLPFYYTDGTTCGACSLYSSDNACGSSYLNGEEYMFKYTPTEDIFIEVELTTSETYVGVIITKGCPDTGLCVGTATSTGGVASGGPFYLQSGVTYYFSVSSNSSYNSCISDFDLDIIAVEPPDPNPVCMESIAFCSGENFIFPASVNVPDNGYFGCLHTTPNPAWYYMEIGTSGDIIIDITSNYDVDFIAWGPYSSLETACIGIPLSSCSECPNNTYNPDFYPYGSIVDCSYDPAAYETVSIFNAQVGEIYVLLITNFKNSVTDIEFSQTSGTGAANCEIVAPPITQNGPLCVGDDLELGLTYPTTGTVSWTGPDSFESTSMNPVINDVTLANAGTYSLVITVGTEVSDTVTTVVVINPILDPSFDQFETYCEGAVIPDLPTLSNNGIHGTWSPAINNMLTTQYTFTPGVGECGNTAFMTVTVEDCGSLPVKLTDFKVEFCKNGRAGISWTTMSEYNNNYFTLFRSNDGKNYNPIVKVAGQGNSSGKYEYFYLDENVVDEYTYYRLLQTDFDGSSSWSEVIFTYCTNEISEFYVSPNPFRYDLIVSFVEPTEQKYELKITDALGKMVLQDVIPERTQVYDIVDIDKLLPGVYNLVIQTDKKYYTRKIVKM